MYIVYIYLFFLFFAGEYYTKRRNLSTENGRPKRCSRENSVTQNKASTNTQTLYTVSLPSCFNMYTYIHTFVGKSWERASLCFFLLRKKLYIRWAFIKKGTLHSGKKSSFDNKKVLLFKKTDKCKDKIFKLISAKYFTDTSHFSL